MYCANVVGNKFCLCQIRCAFKSNGKRVELRPPCVGFSAFFYTFRRIFLCHCRYYRTVKSSAKEHTIGNIAHKLAFNGCFKRIAQFQNRSAVVFYVLIVGPIPLVPFVKLSVTAVIVMSGRKCLVFIAESLKSLKLRAEINSAFFIASYI